MEMSISKFKAHASANANANKKQLHRTPILSHLATDESDGESEKKPVAANTKLSKSNGTNETHGIGQTTGQFNPRALNPNPAPSTSASASLSHLQLSKQQDIRASGDAKENGDASGSKPGVNSVIQLLRKSLPKGAVTSNLPPTAVTSSEPTINSSGQAVLTPALVSSRYSLDELQALRKNAIYRTNSESKTQAPSASSSKHSSTNPKQAPTSSEIDLTDELNDNDDEVMGSAHAIQIESDDGDDLMEIDDSVKLAQEAREQRTNARARKTIGFTLKGREAEKLQRREEMLEALKLEEEDEANEKILGFGDDQEALRIQERKQWEAERLKMGGMNLGKNNQSLDSTSSLPSKPLPQPSFSISYADELWRSIRGFTSLIASQLTNNEMELTRLTNEQLTLNASRRQVEQKMQSNDDLQSDLQEFEDNVRSLNALILEKQKDIDEAWKEIQEKRIEIGLERAQRISQRWKDLSQLGWKTNDIEEVNNVDEFGRQIVGTDDQWKEKRQSTRKMIRERIQKRSYSLEVTDADYHFEEGWCSDTEEYEVEEGHTTRYKTEWKDMLEDVAHIFADVDPDFSSASGIASWFLRFKQRHSREYLDAMIGLSLPKALSMHVKAELMSWSPFSSYPTHTLELQKHLQNGTSTTFKGDLEPSTTSAPLEFFKLECFNWFTALRLFALSEISNAEDSTTSLMFKLVNQLVVPYLIFCADHEWNVSSSQENGRMRSWTLDCLARMDNVRGSEKKINTLKSTIVHWFGNAVDQLEKNFLPYQAADLMIHSQTAIYARYTFCKAQYFYTSKLLSMLFGWNDICNENEISKLAHKILLHRLIPFLQWCIGTMSVQHSNSNSGAICSQEWITLNTLKSDFLRMSQCFNDILPSIWINLKISDPEIIKFHQKISKLIEASTNTKNTNMDNSFLQLDTFLENIVTEDQIQSNEAMNIEGG